MNTLRELVMSVLSVDDKITSAEVVRRTGLSEKQVSTALSALVIRQKTIGRSKLKGSVSKYYLLKPYARSSVITGIGQKLELLRSLREVLPDQEQLIVDQIINDYERIKGVCSD